MAKNAGRWRALTASPTVLVTVGLLLVVLRAWRDPGPRSSNTRLGAARASSGPASVLVTGFAPFRNFTFNPSGEAALALDGHCAGMGTEGAPEACFDGRLLTVDRAGASAVAELLGQAGGSKYCAVVLLGFEDSAKGLRLELAAANVRATEDNPGWSADVFECAGTTSAAAVDPIAAGAGQLLATTAPVDRLSLARLRRTARSQHLRNATELWSRDAGAYWCNELYFRTLDHVRKGGGGTDPLTPVLFVHLPPPSVASMGDITVLVEDIAQVLVGGPATFPS